MVSTEGVRISACLTWKKQRVYPPVICPLVFSRPHGGRLIRPLVFVSHKEHIGARLSVFFFMRYRLRS